MRMAVLEMFKEVKLKREDALEMTKIVRGSMDKYIQHSVKMGQIPTLDGLIGFFSDLEEILKE